MAKFSELPRELRSMIYHYTWQATARMSIKTMVTTDSPSKLCFEYEPLDTLFPRRTYSLPSWLLTNKMFLTEGLDELNRCGRAIIEPMGASYDAITYPGLLHPLTCRNLYIGFPVYPPTFGDEVPCAISEMTAQNLLYCETLIANAARLGILQRLTVRTVIPFSNLVKDVKLDVFGAAMQPIAHQLVRLEFIIGLQRWKGRDDTDTIDALLREKIAELDRGYLAGMVGNSRNRGTIWKTFWGKKRTIEWRIVWTRR